MIKAIDVSSWQHPGGAEIDWHAVKADGYDGVWIKCSQGTNYTNPFFVGDYDGATAAGLVVGAYHFAEPWHNTPEAEANYALAAVGGRSLDLGLALDWERLGSLAPHEAGNWVPAWLAAVAEHHTLAPFYTDQSLLEAAAGAPWGYPLWIADPSGTYTGAYWAKQTGKAAVPGIQGQTDVDVIENVRGVNPTQGQGPTTVAPGAGQPPATTPAQPTNQPTTGGMLDVNVPELSINNPGPSQVSGAVKTLQTLLVDRFGVNLSANGGIDGRFGTATENAVKWVQGESHGALQADGIVGPATWSWLVNFNG